MFGLSDFDITGSLRDWNIREQLKKLMPEVAPGQVLLMR
jgi:L-proline amide hydrolase